MAKKTAAKRSRAKRGRTAKRVDPQPNGPIDRDRIAAAVREILLGLGEDPDREGLRRTPDRVARMYEEVFAGLREDPARHLKAVFTERYDEMIALRDIAFYSMCEHHLMPFTGRAHIAYVPDGRVIGISKLARIVECFARRPQVQERLTSQIADLLMDGLGAKGVAVVIEASHACMTIRGVKKPGSEMVTSAVRGLFKRNPATRNEVLSFLQQRL
jgi:GTP cyclohydrolase IA